MTFGDALVALREGKHLYRVGWDAKAMWIRMFYEWQAREGDRIFPRTKPFIAVRITTGEFVPWAASQTDLLETDWEEWPRHE